jgi:hypothetical protein
MSRLTALILSAVLASGCGVFDDPSPNTPTSQTPTETFSGTLAVAGSNVFSFTVKQAGSVSVTLVSLSTPSPVAVSLGFGTFSQNTTCKVTSSTLSVLAGSTPQMTVTVDPGTFCVNLSDAGNLTASAAFTINIAHS